MSGPPRVTVVIASHNAAADLPHALASVLAQTFTEWEVVVGDDASTDDTVWVLAEYTQRDPRIRSVRLPENRGSGAARNAAWRAGTGEWVAILDADDSWDPEKLAWQLVAVDARPEARWSFHPVRRVCEGEPLDETAVPADVADSLVYSDHAVVHSSVLYRRDALVELGGFDEGLRRSQDWDLFLRLLDRYGPEAVVAVPEVLATYRVRRGFLPPALVAHGRRCQARVVRRMLGRRGWLWRCPRRAWRLVDGYVDRQVEWARALGERGRAARWSMAAVALAPAKRWRWRRVLDVMRPKRQSPAEAGDR